MLRARDEGNGGGSSERRRDTATCSSDRAGAAMRECTPKNAADNETFFWRIFASIVRKAVELKTFFSVFFLESNTDRNTRFFWPWLWRISRISVRISVLAEVGEN